LYLIEALNLDYYIGLCGIFVVKFEAGAKQQGKTQSEIPIFYIGDEI